jgi:DNA-binding MarR family transcriptional regulator
MKLYELMNTGEDVKLTEPTDFDILEILSEGDRETPKHLGTLLEFRNAYMSQRVRQMEDYGLVERIDDSQMFVITELGRVALDLQNQYSHDESRKFGELVKEEVARRERCNCYNDADADIEA